MKYAFAAVSACLAAALIAVAVITHGALSRQDQQITQQSKEIGRLQSRMLNVTSSVNGSHRDLITCADLEHLQMSGISDDGSQVSVGYENGGGTNGVVLPSHCINQ